MLLMINRNKMWTFILLYILGLNILQSAGQVLPVSDNSTQMYYVKLTIEKSAIGNITEILKPFVSNTSLKVDDLKKTTICQSFSASKECTCRPHNRWSDKVCKSNRNCCGNNICSFPKNSSSMCVSTNTVNIEGSISLKRLEYKDCLAERNSPNFLQCDYKVLEEIKSVYSTLRGFDAATINNYRIGSVIADFEMIIAHNIRPQDLIDKSVLLIQKLKASLELETTGVVFISMPHNPVNYNSQHILTCTLQEDLKVPPVWQLKRKGSVLDITNGTRSEMTSETKKAKVTIRDISEVWAGVYSCIYHQKSESYTISHKASAVVDVCLQPNIDITTSPGFPHCIEGSDLLSVRVNCEIKRSDKEYTVTWTGQHIITEIKPLELSSSSDGTDVYAADVVVSCNLFLHKPQLTCTFRNRCNQERSASIDVNIIYGNEPFCEAELDWEKTKAGFTAVLKCNKNAAGKRQRQCETGSSQQSKPRWKSEYSACVNQEVNNVLQMANIVDIGLGSLDENAAEVFSLLHNITRDTQAINNFANINASIYVIFTLSQKQNLQPKHIAVDDFLDSSSNMLDKALKDSWKTDAGEGNLSLAERYLSSVEQLVQMVNITGINQKDNVEVATQNCSQGSHCTNMVLNVTIILNSPDPGIVKSTGFKELEALLPCNDDKYKPNSIVVSTIIERKQSDSVNIKIMFPLLKSRPRNVEMKCVSWDNNTRTWSSNGCQWVIPMTPSNEEHCVCNHLSSFAILMSKYPLEINGINEITSVGLSISVISLIICLVIELAVWSIVVKTNTLYLRHTAHVNICVCLLVADCCFLASSNPQKISEIWCKTFVVLKHFCYLSMFFWMLCLSTTLLHQAVFLFHNVSKKNYLRFSLVLGYVCPFVIVAITFLANNGGAEGMYFSSETCWLVYTGSLTGSIHTFLIPVGIIVFVNMFSMLVVIMKLLNHPKNTEKSQEKKAAIAVMRSVILLTPIFGVTWIFGFAVMVIELTSGTIAFIVNYAFILLNTFQGLFILLTTCLGDKLIREALEKRLKIYAPASTNDSSTKLDSTLKK